MFPTSFAYDQHRRSPALRNTACSSSHNENRINIPNHFCMHLLFPAMHPSISLLFYGNQAAIPLPCYNLFLILTYYYLLDQLLITVNVQEEESGGMSYWSYYTFCIFLDIFFISAYFCHIVHVLPFGMPLKHFDQDLFNPKNIGFNTFPTMSRDI